MIVVCNRILVNAAYVEAFEKRFSERASLVDDMDGFVSFHLLRPQNPDDPYVVMTFWESAAHYKAWTNSDEFKQGHVRSGTLPKEAFAARPTLEVFEVISNTAQIDSVSE